MSLRVIAASFLRPLALIGLRMGGAVAAFALNLILARAMSPADMGTALSYMSMALLGAVVVTLSIEAGCVRMITRYTEAGELARARGMVRLSRGIVIVFGSALVLLIAAAAWVWSDRTEAPYPWIVIVMALSSVCMAWLRVGETHAMAFGAVLRSLMPTSLYRQAFLLAGIGIWFALFGSLDVMTVLVLMLAGLALSVLMQDLANRRLYAALGAGVADIKPWREWAKLGLQLGVALLFVRYSRDIMLVVSSVTLDPADVAVLGIATALIGFAKFGVVAVNQSITPELARAMAREDVPGVKALLRRSNHMKFWPMLVAFAALAVLGPAILGLFGPSFADGTPILLILMIEPIALAFFGPGAQCISFSNRQHLMLPLSIFALVLYCAAIITGGWLGGLIGAAWGSSLAWVCWTAILAIASRRVSGYGITLVSGWRRGDGSQ